MTDFYFVVSLTVAKIIVILHLRRRCRCKSTLSTDDDIGEKRGFKVQTQNFAVQNPSTHFKYSSVHISTTVSWSNSKES